MTAGASWARAGEAASIAASIINFLIISPFVSRSWFFVEIYLLRYTLPSTCFGQSYPGEGLPGPLQGQQQGRARLRWLVRSPPEQQPVPPQQEQPRGQDTHKERGEAAPRTCLTTREGEGATA